MHQLLELFSPDADFIEIDCLDTLTAICRFHPHRTGEFFAGLVLGENLVNEKGVTLYTKGVKLTHDRVARLAEICDNNPSMKLKFKIQRSEELIDNFRNDILRKLDNLIVYRKKYRVYTKLLKSTEKELRDSFGALLSSENVVLTFYRMKFSADSAGDKYAAVFFNQSISVALFAYAIARLPFLREHTGFTDEDDRELIRAAVFHNIGALVAVESILQKRGEERARHYYQQCTQARGLLKDTAVTEEALTAILNMCKYHFGETAFTALEKSKADWMSNILLAAEYYVQYEMGLFDVKKKPSHIIDAMNVLAVNGKINKTVVAALTIGLELNDIFDFYQEMDMLQHLCTFEGGGHAWPYPMTGFKSPTIFICKDNVRECQYCEKSLKAVMIVQDTENLPEGRYARCMLSTPPLIRFYKEHYDVIKKDQSSQKKQEKK